MLKKSCLFISLIAVTCNRMEKFRLNQVFFIAVSICMLLNGCAFGGEKSPRADEAGIIEIVDDQNVTVRLKSPAKRIISLYSAHTENLLSLGLDEEIIGVSATEYSPIAKSKRAFDYRGDPENILAAEPDLVLIRPFIRQGYPSFVKTLENANIKVVSLYPETFEDFDEYIQKLALLTGKSEQAEKELKMFHVKLSQINEKTKKTAVKKKVYFEATANEYRTITPESVTGNLLKIAGAVNIASNALPIRRGSSIASYGEERLLEKGTEIDVYIAQTGAMNPGITPKAIKERPGFNSIKAIQNNEVYIIEEFLVSAPTFRLADGAVKLSEIIYPD